MKEDQVKWDLRYQKKAYPREVSESIKEFYHLAKVGKALDIAAGIGRNACFLFQKGFQVDAVDISRVGLDEIKAKCPGVNTVHIDLDVFQIKENNYDLVCNINFLQRRLFPYIVSGLKPEGIVIIETFLDPRLSGGVLDPEKKDQYLMVNELLHAFLSFHIIHYRETEVTFPKGELIKRATLVAQKTSIIPDLRDGN